jgi:membrane protein DedA with SNARE-associated domain
MFDQTLIYLSGARVYITGHPVQSILILGLIFALSSAMVETVLYWMARLGGRPLVFRYSRWLRLDTRKLDKVEAMYARWGIRMVFFGRFLPGVKALLSVPAGVSRMNFGAYIGASFSAAYIYNILWFAGAFLLGKQVTMFGVAIW